jgi:AcrR family transcriptional regulator
VLVAGRPVDLRRRAELLDAAVEHATAQGFAELSWRSIAAALGVSTTTLVHHFGTKEQLLEAILGRLRERTEVAAGEHPDLAAAARAVWAWCSAPEQGPTFRLFFAVFGAALQAPGPFGGFLDVVGVDWMDTLRAAQGLEADPETATRRATLVVATIRGLLLDLLASGDRARIDGAAEAFFAALAGPGP